MFMYMLNKNICSQNLEKLCEKSQSTNILPLKWEFGTESPMTKPLRTKALLDKIPYDNIPAEKNPLKLKLGRTKSPNCNNP